MWKTVKLGEVLQTGAGGTPLKSKKEFYAGGNIKWLLSGAVCKKEIYNSETFITQAGLENSSAKIFPPNTVLVAMYGATAGQVGILKVEACTNQAVCGIYPSENYLPEFLYYFLLSYKEKLLEKVSGVAQPNLSQIKIKNIPLPVISLAEQQRIVAKLDAVLAEIENAKYALEQEKVRYKHFVRAAVMSKLEDIDKRHTSDFEQVCDFVRGPFGGSLKKSMFVEKGFAVYEQQHPINDQFDNFRYFVTDEKFLEMERFAVRPGDVLMSCSGSLGKTGIVPTHAPKGIINQALLKITPRENILAEYLQLVMRSDLFQSLIWNVSGGVAQPNVPPIKVIKKLPLPVPPVTEQKIILNWAHHLMEAKLEVILDKKLKAFAQLKSAILSKELKSETA